MPAGGTTGAAGHVVPEQLDLELAETHEPDGARAVLGGQVLDDLEPERAVEVGGTLEVADDDADVVRLQLHGALLESLGRTPAA